MPDTNDSDDIRLYRSLQRVLASGRDHPPAACLQAMLASLVGELEADFACVGYGIDTPATRLCVVAETPVRETGDGAEWLLEGSPAGQVHADRPQGSESPDLGPRALVVADDDLRTTVRGVEQRHRGFLGVALRDRFDDVVGSVSLCFTEPLTDPRRRGAAVSLVEMVALKFQSMLTTLLEDLERERLLVRLDAGTAAADVDIDPLVRLGNRRRFEARLEAAADNHATTGRTYGILLVDLDRFSSVNAALGHAVGDDVLRAVARCLVRRTRAATEQIFRYGDDRFAVLCDSPRDLWGLRDQADRLVRSIRGVESTSTTPIPATTASVGGAVVREPDPTGRTVLERAEAALELAKRSGRDRACVDGID
ncbi:MAG: diguanylate cyclase domain-containing protein [Armatimonadota bacterium]